MKVDGSKGSNWTVLKMYTVPKSRPKAVYRIKTWHFRKMVDALRARPTKAARVSKRRASLFN